MLNLYQLSQDHPRSPLEDSFFVLSLVFIRCTKTYFTEFIAIDNAVKPDDCQHPRYFASIKAKYASEIDMQQLASCLGGVTDILFSDFIAHRDKTYLVHKLFLRHAAKAKSGSLRALLVEACNLLATHFADNDYYRPEQKKVLNEAYRKLDLSKKAKGDHQLLPLINTQKKITKKQYTPPLTAVPAFFDSAQSKERAVLTTVFAVKFWHLAQVAKASRTLHPDVMDSLRLASFCAPYLQALVALSGDDFYFDTNKWRDIKIILAFVRLPDEARESLFALLENFVTLQHKDIVAQASIAYDANYCLSLLQDKTITVSTDDIPYVPDAATIAELAQRITTFFDEPLTGLSLADIDALFSEVLGHLRQQVAPDRQAPKSSLSPALQAIAEKIKQPCQVYLTELEGVDKNIFLDHVTKWKDTVYMQALIRQGAQVLADTQTTTDHVADSDAVAGASRPRSSTAALMAYLNEGDGDEVDVKQSVAMNVPRAMSSALTTENEVDVPKVAAIDPEIAAILQSEKENQSKRNKAKFKVDSLRVASFPNFLPRPGSCRLLGRSTGDLHRDGQSQSPALPAKDIAKIGVAHDDIGVHTRLVY